MNTTTTETTSNETTTWSEVAAASDEAELRAAENRMPPRRFMAEASCKLTDDELRTRGDELESALADIDTLTEEKKSNAASFKARIELAKERVGDIRDAIRTKKELRDVEMIESFEYRLGVARIVRTDTGELVSERALTGAERQPSLPGVSTDDIDEDDDTGVAADEESDSGAQPFDDEDDAPSIEDPQAVLDGEPAAVAAKKRARRAKKAGGAA